MHEFKNNSSGVASALQYNSNTTSSNNNHLSRNSSVSTSKSAPTKTTSKRIGSTYEKTFSAPKKTEKVVKDPIRTITGRKDVLAKEGIMPTKHPEKSNAVRGTIAKKLGVQSSTKDMSANPKISKQVTGAFGRDQWDIEFEEEKLENILPQRVQVPKSADVDNNTFNWTERLGRGKCTSICDLNGKPTINIESSALHWYILTYEEKSFLDLESEDFDIHTCLKIQKPYENSLFAIVIDYGISKRFKDEYIAVIMNCGQKYWKIEKVESKKTTPVQQAIDKTLTPLKLMDIRISLTDRKLSLQSNGSEIFNDVILPLSTEGSKERRVGMGVFSSKATVYSWKVFDPKEEQKSIDELPLMERPFPEYVDKSLAEMIKRDIIEFNPNVKWDDIAELHDAKRLLKEAVVLPLLMPDIFAGLRSPWKGVLLFGPPGTGKTMVARAVATEGKTTFFNCSASTLVSKYHGESERLVKTLFQLARLYSPSTVFFDEIDALMMTRGSASEHEASRRLKSELLSQIDGINSQNSRVMVLATTNKPWDLDEAMRRRLEKRIYIPLPDEKTREALFKNFLKEQELEPDVSIEALASMTEGYSGADIHLICKEAALRPLRKELETKSTEEIMKLKEEGKLRLSLKMEDFSESIKNMKPSVSGNEVDKYLKFVKEFQSV
ncbi:hypothetical protein FDP41_008973 [Naegleria fowleri]|uniref:Katanin p60 ATPase-containing subunit A1 n=1 Tax=Naegleria fowleri TaxID=5763 RepID=A0A6A5BFA5_NAEFO|nr:uncharacterized protein FDP41_008973 [Naegleria fowleri]KAF0972724.1 hypothetical protein FDP41_008973 [Naegleria fowleri]